MQNLAMKELLAKADCIDLAQLGQEQSDGTFLLEQSFPNFEYIHSTSERWVISIGRRLSDGKILAAFDSRFYQDPNYECVWLR